MLLGSSVICMLGLEEVNGGEVYSFWGMKINFIFIARKDKMLKCKVSPGQTNWMMLLTQIEPRVMLKLNVWQLQTSKPGPELQRASVGAAASISTCTSTVESPWRSLWSLKGGAAKPPTQRKDLLCVSGFYGHAFKTERKTVCACCLE